MEIVQTILIALASFFANPITYFGLLLVYIIASKRVKKERSSFHTRVYRRLADFIVPFWPALLIGLCLSVLLLGIGFVLEWQALAIMMMITFLIMLTFQLRWLSPSYIIGFTIIALVVIPLTGDYPFIHDYIDLMQVDKLIPILSLLLGLLVIAEGILIQKNGTVYTSPRLERASRGKWIGFHLSERIWFLPLIVFIPDGIIPMFEYWPVLPVAGMELQPLLIPFLIGFKQKITSSLPKDAIRSAGRQVLVFGIVLLLLAISTLFVGWIAYVVAGIAIIGREYLWHLAKTRDKQGLPMYVEQTEGCTILGVLPGSLADKLDLKVGETIVKVNGRKVIDETSFYEALQANSAFCKLDVLDYDQEVRFEQGALYDSEHHQLGVLLVKKDVSLSDSVT
ncbi:PDZ domain-containing protein [Alkalihalobacillus sp. FSL W8-0930]